MFTDVSGYTRLTQVNESETLRLLENHRKLVRPIFATYGGREIKTIGDAFLVEFGSALDAVLCAVAVQSAQNDMKLTRGESLAIKIGVHVGDVIEKDNDVLGDAVNIASRIEPLAEPGGVCVSEQVYDQVRNKVPYALAGMGARELKNVGEPVTVYKVLLPWEHAPKSSPQGVDSHRVAVLPFANMSPDPNDEYFADGMTEELIDRLAQVKGLEVIARTSVMSYKKKDMKIAEIAKELIIGSVVEGSVRKAGNRVRVTAQLINGSNEAHLWSSHYDGSLDDIFAVQSEIAEKVAEELKVHLLDSDKKTIGKPTENTEAYTLYLRGRQLVGERTEPSFRQALRVFEQAISLDPSFAKAYAGQAKCYAMLANDGYEPDERVVPKAELAVKKAVQLDPELAEAHAILADLDFALDDVRGSEVEVRRAIELNPSLPEAYWILSSLAFVRGDAEEGIRTSETCYRLDPLMPLYVSRLGMFYFYLGRESEALSHWEKTAQLAPAGTYRTMSEYYLYKGEMEKAKQYHSMAEKLEPTHRWVAWMRGFMAARSGDREGAFKAIKEIENKWFGVVNLNEIGYIYYALGDLDSYFEYINRAMDQHVLQYAWVMYCPLFAKAREDPRYGALLEKFRRQTGLAK